MDIHVAAKLGAGLAAIGVAGAGVGIGTIFAALVTSIARNPASEAQVRPLGLLGFALSEGTAIFALAIALMILFL
ncbi:MAG TPA: F0F1 ATP synthase subunit C [Acetobacteraceae bacterium]|nr:F0F1 ATP synthase subunit C [Acetobacteraceae bacterium]